MDTDKMDTDKKEKPRFRYVLEIMGQIRGFNGFLAVSVVVNTMTKLFNALLFAAAMAMLDRLAQQQYQAIGGYLAAVVLLIAGKVLCSYFDTYVSHDMSFRILTRLRERVYDRIEQVAPGGLLGRAAADYVTVITSDINVFEWFYAHVLVEWIGIGFVSAILLVMLFQYFPAAAGLTLASICGLLLIFWLGVKQAEDKGYLLKQLFGRLNSTISDGIKGLKDIIGYHGEETFLSKLQKDSATYSQMQMKYHLKSAGEKGGMALIADAAVLAVIFMVNQTAAVREHNHVLLVIGLVMVILSGIQSSLEEGTNYGFVFGAAKRVFTALQIPVPVSDEGVLSAADILNNNEPCKLAFDEVTFRYPGDRKREVLRQVSFSVNPGERVAVVAASGGGKSTLAKLTQRFWDVDSGAVYVNNIDIRRIKLSELRKIITVVPQDIYLFNGTIETNLRLVKPNAGLAEITAAARAAQADSFITRMEDGYQTKVGENGTLLSGGEKQRLALAQAFLMGAPILIMDEATSALDSENERLVNCAVSDFGRTTIVIAHRLATIKSADKIVFLKDGQVSQIGTYEDLVIQNEAFRKLVSDAADKGEGDGGKS